MDSYWVTALNGTDDYLLCPRCRQDTIDVATILYLEYGRTLPRDGWYIVYDAYHSSDELWRWMSVH